jgi:hypothetical protein
MKSESRKRTTAITSCVHKKKSGVVVVRSTHLFLFIELVVALQTRGMQNVRHDHLLQLVLRNS